MSSSPPASGTGPIRLGWAGRLALGILLALLLPAPAAAQEATVDRADLEARVAQTEASTTLEEDTRAEVLTALRAALELATVAEQWEEKAQAFVSDASAAPDRIASIRAELAESRDVPAPPTGQSLSELEQSLATARAELDAARKLAADLDAEASARTERRLLLPELLAGARSRLAEIDEPPTPDLDEDPVELVEARRVQAQAERDALLAEIEAYEQEISSIDVRRDLLTARRNRAAREVAFGERKVDAWQEAVGELRLREAERSQREADRRVEEVSALHPALAERAREVAALAAERAELALSIEALNAEREAVSQRLDSIRTGYADTQRKLEAAGLTEAIGRLLRQRRLELLGSERSVSAEDRKAEIARTQYRIIELENRRAALLDVEGNLAEFRASLDGAGAGEVQALVTRARELLGTEQEHVQSLVDDYQRYFSDQVTLDTQEREATKLAEEFRHYINEHVLWVHSSVPLWETKPSSFTEVLLWLVDPAAWGQALTTFLNDLRTGMPETGAAALLLAALFLSTGRLRKALRAAGERASRATERSILPTIQALVLTLVAAVPLPALLAFLAWRLDDLSSPTQLAALDQGLPRAALLLYLLQVVALTVRNNGLGLRHFDWSEASVAVVRKNLWWFTAVVVPLEAAVHSIAFHETLSFDESLSRILFVAQMIVTAIFLRRILHAKLGIVRKVSSRRGGLSAGLRGFFRFLGFVAPVALAVLAAIGFFFTACQLSSRIQLSAGFVVALLLAQGVALRWILLVRRRLAIAQARERRAAEQEAREAAAEGVPETVVVEEALDAATISQEVRQLARTVIFLTAFVGMWLIWVDVLPALGVLREVELWSHTEEYTRPASELVDTNGSDIVTTYERLVPVTLADLGLALLIAFAAFITTKRLPALLEIWLLQRLELLQGERYAITTLIRYLLTITGVVLAFDQLGIGWSTVQWLAAGISVGLGFGLQEIFANFVSGLTLLFERPIRVGDWVTVGEIEGIVTRIRIRATTIVDRDKKELVVPNREFVTGQLINWTLSDPVTRVVIPVGIAYGSDTELAEETLLRVGKLCQYSLEEPAPNVVFKEFGSSSLDFELRVFVSGRDIYPRVVHDLHRRIDNAFREAGIEIAFPQRDLHLRSAGPFQALVDKDAD